MTDKITDGPAHGLFGPGIFATGIDLSALDEDTAWRLGVWIGQQLHERDEKLAELRSEIEDAQRRIVELLRLRDEAEERLTSLRKAVGTVADALDLARVIPADWPTEVLEERERLARRLRALAGESSHGH